MVTYTFANSIFRVVRIYSVSPEDAIENDLYYTTRVRAELIAPAATYRGAKIMDFALTPSMIEEFRHRP